jgi:hypothetical protein
METSKWERKHLKKSVLAAALLIGASTMLFQGLTQAATTAEYIQNEYRLHQLQLQKPVIQSCADQLA